MHDDFFEIGGHSLLGVRIAAAIQQALGVDLPLRTIFTHSTIAELGGAINALRDAIDRLAAPVEVPEGEEWEALVL